jgi:hypothetical protein
MRMRTHAPAPDADRPSLRGLAEGLRYAKSRPDLLGTYLIDIGAMFFGVPYAVFPQLVAGLGGPAVLGLLYAAPGIGGWQSVRRAPGPGTSTGTAAR